MGQQFCLDKAYLTIYERKEPLYSVEEREYLCLHCDPNEGDDGESTSAIYKKGPHLHIKVAEHPSPQALLALAIGYLEWVLANAANITEALKKIIQMIKDEILDRV